MNDEDITMLALRCGLHRLHETDGMRQFLRAFRDAVSATEREACAGVCDSYGMPDCTSETARILAAAIRARGEKP